MVFRYARPMADSRHLRILSGVTRAGVIVSIITVIAVDVLVLLRGEKIDSGLLLSNVSVMAGVVLFAGVEHLEG